MATNLSEHPSITSFYRWCKSNRQHIKIAKWTLVAISCPTLRIIGTLIVRYWIGAIVDIKRGLVRLARIRHCQKLPGDIASRVNSVGWWLQGPSIGLATNKRAKERGGSGRWSATRWHSRSRSMSGCRRERRRRYRCSSRSTIVIVPCTHSPLLTPCCHIDLTSATSIWNSTTYSSLR